MRVIIAGSRIVKHCRIVNQAIKDSGFPITEVICGMADGPDRMGASWARANKIPVREFPADWYKHGKSAGILRNIEMADNADALIAIWDGKSRGTRHMIDIAAKKGLRVSVFQVSAETL